MVESFFRHRIGKQTGCTTPRAPESAGAARTFGSETPTADSAAGGFVRQFPHLPVTTAVGALSYLTGIK